MLRRSLLLLSLTGLSLLGSGCANPDAGSDAQPRYRTVRAEPGRDTRKAREANQRGIEHLEADELRKAEETFRDALTADVEFGPAHNNLGKVHHKRGDYYRAAREFDAARRLMPEHPAPYNNLGLVVQRDAQLDRAVQYFRKAVEHAPDNIRYKANLAAALVRRGDQTKEVRRLLRQIVDQDERPEWLMWAKRQLAGMKDDTANHPSADRPAPRPGTAK